MVKLTLWVSISFQAALERGAQFTAVSNGWV